MYVTGNHQGYLGNQNRDNSLVIYLIHAICKCYLKTTSKSHKHNLSWHCCTAMDMLYLKGNVKLVKQCMSFPQYMYTTSFTRQHFSLFVVENWHKWTRSAHWQECLLMLWFQFMSFYIKEEIQSLLLCIDVMYIYTNPELWGPVRLLSPGAASFIFCLLSEEGLPVFKDTQKYAFM